MKLKYNLYVVFQLVCKNYFWNTSLCKVMRNTNEIRRRMRTSKTKFRDISKAIILRRSYILCFYDVQVSVSCEEVIDWFKFSQDEYYKVGGNRSTCNRYFQTLYGDGNSVCFTFNMLPASDLFQDDVYVVLQFYRSRALFHRGYDHHIVS